MRKAGFHIVFALLLLAACAEERSPLGQERWAAYYNNELPATAFKPYDLVVFDRLYPPRKFDKIQRRTTVLAYISIGEVHGDVPEKDFLAESYGLLGHGTRWGSEVADLTSTTWRSVLMGQVEDALAKGFDGVMLDTADSALHYAEKKSEPLEQATEEAAIELIKDIRRQYPGIRIMLNRGFAILPRVANDIDFALAESILTETNVSTGQSTLTSPNSYQLAAEKLQAALAVSPKLKIYTLDYWNQDDVPGVANIYAIQRAHGFQPYVSTPDLRRHTPEPAKNSPHLGRSSNDSSSFMSEAPDA